MTTGEHRAVQLGWSPTRPISPNSRRLLIYSQDGLGLGHLRRTTSIAREFLRLDPEAAVLTVSDSPLGTFFGMAANHDCLKLPSLVKSGPNWHALALPMSSGELLSLRSQLIASVASSFRPDLFLVDHMPHGAGGELLPALEVLSRTSTRIVLGLRDILDAPAVTRRLWEDEGAFDAVERHYDQVLVYGARDVFDVGEQYRWPASAASLLSYCGYVCTPEPPRFARRVRSKCLDGSGNSSLIVATAGGGADAYPLMNGLLEALPAIRRQLPCSLAIITGPFMPSAQRRDLMARAQGQQVVVRVSVPDVLSYIGAADVVVSMAGYNTTTEILRSNKPAVVVPRRGPSAEQGIRARLFGERGWVGAVDPAGLSAQVLADAVLSRLHHVAPDNGRPDFGGLGMAVRHLACSEGDRREPAPNGSADRNGASHQGGGRRLAPTVGGPIQPGVP